MSIVTLTATIGLAAIALLVTGTAEAGRRPLAYRVLINHQLAKLPELQADTIFLGDSSLGNAINAALWSEISGDRSVNLALTGAYGFSGSMAMLDRTLERVQPRNVVIMHTADVATRLAPDAAWLDAISQDGTGIAGALAWWRLNMNMQEVWASYEFIRQRGFSTFDGDGDDSIIVNDYIAQDMPLATLDDFPALEGADILAAQLQHLSEIGNTCRDHGLACFYAHGPLAEPYCGRSDSYFQTFNKAIVDRGLRLVTPLPICIQAHELGDSLDHVRPEMKDEFTRRYHTIIATAGSD